MGVYVTFINPSIPHKAESIHLDWNFREAIKFHKNLVQDNRYSMQTEECAIIGTEKPGTVQMDPTKPHWILEEVTVIKK